MMRWNSIRLVSAVTAFLLGAAPGFTQDTSSPTQLTPIRLLTDWYPQPEHGGFYEAYVKGYYRDAGLDVTIVPGGPNSYVIQRLAIGKGEFAMSSSDQVLTLDSQGLNLVAVGATLEEDPLAIMVHEEDSVRRFQDLNGRAIATVPGIPWFRYLISRFGLKNVREVPLTFSVANFVHDPNYIQQAFVTEEPFFAKRAGAKVRLFLLKDTGWEPYRVFCTTRQFLNAHPDIVRKFVAASVRGYRDYMKDPAAANAEIQRRNPQVEPESMEYSWQALRDGNFVYGSDPSGALVGKFDPQRWLDMYHILRSLNVITADIDPTTTFTTEFTKDL